MNEIMKKMMNVLKKILIKARGVQWQLHRRLSTFTIVKSQQGTLGIRLSANDYLGKHLYTRGNYELDIVNDVLSFLRKKGKIPVKGHGCIIDIGANNGVISIGMLYNREFQFAIAIEPEPINFQLLVENIQRNHLSDIMIPLQYAVSDKPGELEFELSDDNSGDNRVRVNNNNALEKFNESHRKTVKVKADNLENLLMLIPKHIAENVALLWLDVQGYEGYVFAGAKNIFSQGIPVVTELWPYGIYRAGMSKEQFCEIAAELWSSYWIKQGGGFIQYPISNLSSFFDILGHEGNFENIIFE